MISAKAGLFMAISCALSGCTSVDTVNTAIKQISGGMLLVETAPADNGPAVLSKGIPLATHKTAQVYRVPVDVDTAAARIGDINLTERWIDLRVEGAKNHREHRVPVASALLPGLEILVNHALEAGAESADQIFNVGLYDLSRRDKYPETMNEYPIRAFFRRVSRECKFTVSPHRFRHTVATHMMKSPDRNLYAVKKLLGHVSITSTLEYIDESVDSLRDILEIELM